MLSEGLGASSVWAWPPRCGRGRGASGHQEEPVNFAQGRDGSRAVLSALVPECLS